MALPSDDVRPRRAARLSPGTLQGIGYGLMFWLLMWMQTWPMGGYQWPF